MFCAARSSWRGTIENFFASYQKWLDLFVNHGNSFEPTLVILEQNIFDICSFVVLTSVTISHWDYLDHNTCILLNSTYILATDYRIPVSHTWYLLCGLLLSMNTEQLVCVFTNQLAITSWWKALQIRRRKATVQANFPRHSAQIPVIQTNDIFFCFLFFMWIHQKQKWRDLQNHKCTLSTYLVTSGCHYHDTNSKVAIRKS